MEEEQTKKENSKGNLWGKIFVAFLTVAVAATIGALLGYYIGAHGPDIGDIYYVGIAREDVTGPIVQVNLMGYAHPEQVADGLHTRLYSRAFVVSDVNKENRMAFVSFDGGMASQLIKLEIVKRLQEKFGNLFTTKNVVISGTHTHSGPAGFFQYLLFEVTSLGHVEQSTESFVSGIVKSIEKAAKFNIESLEPLTVIEHFNEQESYGGAIRHKEQPLPYHPESRPAIRGHEFNYSANSNMVEARIRMGRANVDEGNINRSPTSYDENPLEERLKYSHNTDQEMTVLRFDSTKGDPLGMISWYPVHPTSVNFSNHLVSSDNKGRASMLFEEMMRKENETASGKETFVAAFAQSNLGDVSPRTNGPICIDTGAECEKYSSTCGNRSQDCIGFGPGADHFESCDIIARRQLAAAQKAYSSASEFIKGPISWVHQYVDMGDANVTLDDGTIASTCRPAMGYSFASGCTDGAGAFDFVQGMTEGTPFWDGISEIICSLICSEQPPDEYIKCHRPKPILFPTSYMDRPYDWHPHIVDIQILRLGQLIVPAVPGEYTTMAGRRFREGLLQTAKNVGLPHSARVVIAGLSNVYTHYISTPEEYRAQRYEAASVIFGINTFDVYQKKFENLLKAMIEGKQDDLESGPLPNISPSNQSRLAFVPGLDNTPPGIEFGDVIQDAQPSYAKGEVVNVTFQGANPRHNMKLGETYLEVQRQEDDGWVTIYTDADWSTRFIWSRIEGNSENDVNLFTTLFDVIADATGFQFDIARAIELYEKFDWIGEVFTNDRRKLSHKERRKRVIQKLLHLQLMRVTRHKETKRESRGQSKVTIQWEIPSEVKSGTYRIFYHGDRMKPPNGDVIPFTGETSQFIVK